ncbi:MAG: ABC transporter ATP-binding protein [Alphaproteobacteria bacterium]|nr:ABC transporter ATP-binding protein [Alphaproteobacteria bacterium]MBP7759231.1 ABC transporter ATP-binding protein [Alphaproteobacteria bacterium]MBP7761865.1 ABC transporter ATP-binding protein [Alphaproteobacteria bacterium]MBP7904690.1 ABC transporter ATP-binding protein [Alphaproteobacteria bacterium]
MKPAASPHHPESKGKSAHTARKVAAVYVHPYTSQLIVALLLMAVSAAMTAVLAQLMQPVLDDVLYGQKKELILPVSLGVFATFLVRGVTTYLHTLSMNRIGQGIVADIQRDLFNHFVTLDLAFFHANPSGQLISRVVNDVNVMRMALVETMTGFGKSAFTLLFLFMLMLYQDWKLTLAACLVVPFVSIFLVKIGKRLRGVSGSIQDQMASLSDLLSQSFQGVRMVKAYGMEEHEKDKIGGAIANVRDLNIKSVHIRNLTTPVNETILGLIFSLIIVYGGYQVLAGATTAGGLASFLAAFTLAYEPMKKLARLNGNLQMGLGAADRVFEMMDLKPLIGSRLDAPDLKVSAPEILFENVTFTYEGEGEAALRGVSFTAKPGKVTALVGPSGGGKSTIINLIPRFYDVSGGCIRIDGTDSREVTLASLRRHIALVSQDITIFNDTVYQNIRYGKPEATEQEIFAAAEAAAAHEFIIGFPNAYQTVVGEDGVKLSGGQRQRIAIARAILKDAPILLLDEATSALDNESEKLVQKALQALEKGRTTLVIAHRLTTVQAADQIVVLDRGEIVERGTHESLLQAEGLYAKMYRTGMKG